MSATRLELETTLFSDPGFKEKASRFAMDSSTMVAYITKERNIIIGKDEGDGRMHCRALYPFLADTRLQFRAIHGKLPDIRFSSTSYSSRIFEIASYSVIDQEETNTGRNNPYR